MRPQVEVLESRDLPSWVVVAPMPTARSGLAAAVGTDGRIYAIGGADASGTPLATVETYDPSTNSWRTVSSLPTPLTDLAATVGADGRIYALGGRTSSGVSNLVEAYSPTTNVWTQVATMPTARANLAAAEGSDGRIYAIGGENASGAALATVESYNPTSNSWRTATNLPTALTGLAAAVGPDNRIYAMGASSTSTSSNVVEAYSTMSRVWAQVTNMPTTRSNLAAATGGDGRIYAIAGASSGGSPLAVVEAYTTSGNSWTTADTLLQARFGLAAVRGNDGRIYAIGGSDGTAPLAEMEALTTATKAASSVVVSSSVNPSLAGQSVTFTATVSATGSAPGTPTGNVQFQIDGRPAGRPVSLSTAAGVTTASFTTTTLLAGTHAIQASYSGDATFAASNASLANGQTVTMASTSTVLTSSINPSVVGQIVTFTATIGVVAPGSGAPTGTVQFQLDGSNVGTPVSVSTAGGVTTASFSTSTLAVGTHTLLASYGGDASFAASSATLSGGQVVTPIGTNPSTTIVGASLSAAVFGQMVTFTATVSTPNPSAGTPTGTVQFLIDGTASGNPVRLSTAGGVTGASLSSMALPVGAHTITASYSGDGIFASSSGSTMLTVGKALTSTTVQSSANPIQGGQNVTFTVTISVTTPGAGTPTGTVQFQVDGSNVGSPVTVSTAQGLTTASFSTNSLAGGMHTVQAIYSGDNNFTSSTGTLSGGQVVNVMLPPSNPVFVTQVYRDLLKRAPDPGGQAAFTNALNQGATRYQVVQTILSSPEYHTDLVESLYQTYLGRQADSSGLAVGVQFLNQGGSAEQLATFLVSSPEYVQNRAGGTDAGFLNALYRNALGRTIDPSGQATYTHALATGATHAQVAAAIFSSLEYHQDQVFAYYESYLRREPDASGLNTYVLDLLHGRSDESVIAALVGSPEYFQRL